MPCVRPCQWCATTAPSTGQVAAAKAAVVAPHDTRAPPPPPPRRPVSRGPRCVEAVAVAEAPLRNGDPSLPQTRKKRSQRKSCGSADGGRGMRKRSPGSGSGLSSLRPEKNEWVAGGRGGGLLFLMDWQAKRMGTATPARLASRLPAVGEVVVKTAAVAASLRQPSLRPAPPAAPASARPPLFPPFAPGTPPAPLPHPRPCQRPCPLPLPRSYQRPLPLRLPRPCRCRPRSAPSPVRRLGRVPRSSPDLEVTLG